MTAPAKKQPPVSEGAAAIMGLTILVVIILTIIIVTWGK